jgi:hypothetical protein
MKGSKIMKAMTNLMLIALCALFFSGCGDDPADTDTDSEIVDTNVDTTVVADLQTLVGKSYYILLNQDYWDEPTKDVGPEIGSHIPGFIFTFQSVDSVGMTFTALFGIADAAGIQDPCNKTFDVTGTFGTSPAGSTTFAFNAMEVQMIIAGNDEDSDVEPTKKVAPVHGFAIGGTFVNQGDRFKSGFIDALIDVRDVACMFTILEDPTPDGFCSKMASEFGYACQACAYTGAPAGNYCVPLGANAFKIDAGTTALAVDPDLDMTCVVDTCV